MKNILPVSQINQDKHMFTLPDLPLVTIYDDNWFVRNDYDVLSIGQRNYLIQFFTKQGFKQISGRCLSDGNIKLHFPKPSRNLAQSEFDEKYLIDNGSDFYLLTPTQFAEVIFFRAITNNESSLSAIYQLIDKCPFNIEWLRDISYRSPIETITLSSYNTLMTYQKSVIAEKFKYKKAL